jgi:hypothetical protein
VKAAAEVFSAPRVKVTVRVPKSVDPSWSWKVRVIVPSQLPLAVKVKSLETVPEAGMAP